MDVQNLDEIDQVFEDALLSILPDAFSLIQSKDLRLRLIDDFELLRTLDKRLLIDIYSQKSTWYITGSGSVDVNAIIVLDRYECTKKTRVFKRNPQQKTRGQKGEFSVLVQNLHSKYDLVEMRNALLCALDLCRNCEKSVESSALEINEEIHCHHCNA